MASVQIIRKAQVQAGGQGTVWEGEVAGTGVKVAMKYLTPNPQSLDPDGDRKRFLREVRCQATLSHPNIVRVLGHNSADDPPWYYMPWADSSLRTKIQANSSGLPESEALAVFSQILEAMEYAHSEGVLHRDLKPENVLFIDGAAQVSDFGLSRQLGSDSTTLTMTNVGMGTLAYGAPEQFTDAHQVDARADVYALGKILYELLTGKLPFPALDMASVPPRHRYIIQKATQNDPDRRYSTVMEMARELKLLSDDADVLQPPTERAKRLLEEVGAGDVAKLDELNRLLQENSDDLNLYTQFVPYIPAAVLEAFAARDVDGLRGVVRIFDQYAEGSHPWSYTDTIAAFFERVYYLVDDYDIQRSILSRVLVLGADHNRWFVRDVFIRLVKSACESGPGALMVAEVIRANRGSIPFVEDELRAISLPATVSEALNETPPAPEWAPF
ncbi:hypothetical protein DDE18_15830 [Nocardioides gansuensis]|uniref:non-specific serine/threonine protein kinase n=1 Tax=Nocardioides gansuensis TaxID=2138300 RepID=A0A2T8F8U1_9ACTN|nr:serine/threonine-protein kinase [Nocardioides gansuensis]PVG82144.1 hypothetical protein DDE18_15830 [Nocardioides gansuensis]